VTTTLSTTIISSQEFKNNNTIFYKPVKNKNLTSTRYKRASEETF
jgi:hypothetical protein